MLCVIPPYSAWPLRSFLLVLLVPVARSNHRVEIVNDVKEFLNQFSQNGGSGIGASPASANGLRFPTTTKCLA